MDSEWTSYKDSKRRSYDSAKAQLRSHSQREESPEEKDRKGGSVLLLVQLNQFSNLRTLDNLGLLCLRSQSHEFSWISIHGE